MRRSQRSIRVAALTLALAAFALTSCGSSSKSADANNSPGTSAGASIGTSPGSSTGSSATCQAFDDLKSSISTLTNASTLTGGKSSIQTAIDAVKKNLDTLGTTVKSGDKPKVDALKSDLSDLEKAVGNLDNSGVSGLSDVATAGRSVADSAQALFTTLQAGCPGG